MNHLAPMHTGHVGVSNAETRRGWPAIERRRSPRAGIGDTDPCAPLDRYLVDGATPGDERWLVGARAACEQALVEFERLSAQMINADRDSSVCLDAIRHSLQWASAEAPDALEVRQTMARVRQIFDLLLQVDRRRTGVGG
ncbi:MAG: hypothetical protein H6934_14555 [Burkholderiaceae bacterium]|nr:hypothetical protein [Burkholderiaceae bacterium]